MPIKQANKQANKQSVNIPDAYVIDKYEGRNANTKILSKELFEKYTPCELKYISVYKSQEYIKNKIEKAVRASKYDKLDTKSIVNNSFVKDIWTAMYPMKNMDSDTIPSTLKKELEKIIDFKSQPQEYESVNTKPKSSKSKPSADTKTTKQTTKKTSHIPSDNESTNDSNSDNESDNENDNENDNKKKHKSGSESNSDSEDDNSHKNNKNKPKNNKTRKSVKSESDYDSE
jgi:hypothetical protein